MDDLLGDASDDKKDTLQINEQYAKKYEKRKDREDLVRAKKFLDDDDDSSSSEDEDENAQLLSTHVESKILETLCAIKHKDPRIYDKSQTFFSDQDFKKQKKMDAKAVTYKDFLRDTLLEEGAGAFEDAENAAGKVRQSVKEQHEARSDLLKAAFNDSDAQEEDDDLFVMTEKGAKKTAEEDAEFREFAKNQPEGELAILANKYWRPDEELDSNERFLRDYILHEGWKETDAMQGRRVEIEDGESESDHLDAVDDYERKYNFRFEEEGGCQILGHDRNIKNSVRQKDEKRKRQREARIERKAEEKVRRAEELKRLKNLKKKEIQNRLRQLEEITGNELQAEIDLMADFDPEEHDKQMQKMLGDDYDEREEALKGRALLNARVEEEEETKFGEEDWDQDGGDENWGPEQDEEGGEGQEARQDENGGEAWNEEETEEDLWFLCAGGQRRFDCTVCENFTLCRKCFRVAHHPHRFKRRRVPLKCTPPADWKPEENHASAPSEAPEVKALSDEYFQMDYEDIIGGDLPTKFKYSSVPKCSYGLSAKEIFEKSDKDLNKVVSIKKISRPYKEQNREREENWNWDENWNWNQRSTVRRKKRPAEKGAQAELGNDRKAPKSDKKARKRIKTALSSERAAA